MRRIDERPAVKESSPLGRRFGSAWSTVAERFVVYRLTPVLAIALVIAIVPVFFRRPIITAWPRWFTCSRSPRSASIS